MLADAIDQGAGKEAPNWSTEERFGYAGIYDELDSSSDRGLIPDLSFHPGDNDTHRLQSTATFHRSVTPADRTVDIRG